MSAQARGAHPRSPPGSSPSGATRARRSADLARGARRAEAVALPPHRVEGGPALGGRLGGRRGVPRGLDGVPADAPASERIRLALRAHLAVVAGQLDIATVFVREWRYLDGRAARAVRRRAPPLRGAHPRPLPRGRRGQRAAHRPRRRDRRAALPLGGELGLHLASARRATPTSSPTGSTRALLDGMRGYATP